MTRVTLMENMTSCEHWTEPAFVRNWPVDVKPVVLFSCYCWKEVSVFSVDKLKGVNICRLVSHWFACSCVWVAHRYNYILLTHACLNVCAPHFFCVRLGSLKRKKKKKKTSWSFSLFLFLFMTRISFFMMYGAYLIITHWLVGRLYRLFD